MPVSRPHGEGRDRQRSRSVGPTDKAIEKATAENHWNAAQFLELLPPENSTLLEKDEELLYLATEYLTELKLKGVERPHHLKGIDKGSGKGKEGQKGAKHKGKKKDASNKEET